MTSLLFFHIPKTAGTTFAAICRRRFAPEATLSVDPASDPSALSRIAAMSPQERAAIEFVHAHTMPAGVLDFFEDATKVCFLRDPVDRVISAYHHIARFETHPAHARLVEGGMNLEQFAASDLCEQSGQARILSGVPGKDWVTGHGPLGPDVLQAALDNLARFDFVGLTERFEDSLLLLRRLLGWTLLDIVYHAENTAPSWQQTAVPAPVRSRILELNQLDAELYALARTRFEARFRDAGDSIESERRLLRVLSAPYRGHRRLLARSRTYGRARTAVRLLWELVGPRGT